MTIDLINILMVVITALSVIVALYSVKDGQKRYIDSIQPVISFKLSPNDSWLDLEILNSGKSAARSINIMIENITELEYGYEECYDFLSGITFDLFPEEIVRNHIAILCMNDVRNVVTLKVSYIDEWDEKHEYVRKLSVCNEPQC